MTQKSARDALIYERLRQSFDYEEDDRYVKEYLQGHIDRGLRSPYVDCPDHACRFARDYADEVLARLESHGYHPVRRDGPVLYVSPEGWDELMEDLDAPPKVNEKLRALMQQHDNSIAIINSIHEEKTYDD